MSVPFSNYPNLNQFALLAGGTITNNTSTVINPYTPYNTYYGTSSSPPTITGTGSFTGAGATQQGNPNNTLAATASGELSSLVTELGNKVTAGSTAFPLAIGGNYILQPNTNYSIPGSLVFTAAQTVTFNGPGQYIIYLQPSGSGSITMPYVQCGFGTSGGNLSNTQIYWFSPNTITLNSFSAPIGTFIATNEITASDLLFTGNLYSFGGLNLNSSGVGSSVQIYPLTLCYLKGTKILTPTGYTNVEDLQVGDHVLSYGSIGNNADVQLSESGEAKPIKWISSFYGVKRDASDLPICFTAGSLGENAPSSDLFVSPGHRVIIDGKMVVARDAVNGETIVQEDTLETIEYYHFELDEHSVVMAEGVLAETFLELDKSKTSFQ